jgi:hypothetical protein
MVAPDEHHRGTRRGRKQDEAGDVAVDLVRRQIGLEQPADEEPAQERHRERFYGPVDEERDRDAPPMFLDPRQRRKIDLHEHGDDHQPDQDSHRHVDLGDFGRTDDVEYRGKEVPKCDPNNDAKSNPNGEVAFESRHGQTRILRYL